MCWCKYAQNQVLSSGSRVSRHQSFGRHHQMVLVYIFFTLFCLSVQITAHSWEEVILLGLVMQSFACRFKTGSQGDSGPLSLFFFYRSIGEVYALLCCQVLNTPSPKWQLLLPSFALKYIFHAKGNSTRILYSATKIDKVLSSSIRSNILSKCLLWKLHGTLPNLDLVRGCCWQITR